MNFFPPLVLEFMNEKDSTKFVIFSALSSRVVETMMKKIGHILWFKFLSLFVCRPSEANLNLSSCRLNREFVSVTIHVREKEL